MIKRFAFIVLFVGFGLSTFADNEGGIVAVFVKGDPSTERYMQSLQTYMEEGLVDCSYSIVEHSQEYKEIVKEYNTYLQGSSVSEFAFDNIASEKLADKLCFLYIKKLAAGSYRIEATLVNYGQTNSQMKKSYPSLGESKLNLEEHTDDHLQVAVIEILCKLNLISSSRRDEMLRNYNDQKEKMKEKITKMTKKVNGNAFAASMFIPGAGQMYKGRGGAGTCILLSEVALVGGGTYLYFLRKQQADIMTSTGITYDEYAAASDLKKTYNIAMWCCYGAGAAIHLVNMINAYTCVDKKKRQRFTMTPVVIPTNEFTTPQYAYGMGISYTF